MIGLVAMKAREELSDLWSEWATRYGTRLLNQPTVATVMADQEQCLLYVCTSVKGAPRDASFMDKLQITGSDHDVRNRFLESHELQKRNKLWKTLSESINETDIHAHKYKANCGEVHAILQWHLKNPGTEFPQDDRRIIMATASLDPNIPQRRALIYNPCGPVLYDTTKPTTGCKVIVERLKIWAILRGDLEKATTRDQEDQLTENLTGSLEYRGSISITGRNLDGNLVGQ